MADPERGQPDRSPRHGREPLGGILEHRCPSQLDGRHGLRGRPHVRSEGARARSVDDALLHGARAPRAHPGAARCRRSLPASPGGDAADAPLGDGPVGIRPARARVAPARPGDRRPDRSGIRHALCRRTRNGGDPRRHGDDVLRPYVVGLPRVRRLRVPLLSRLLGRRRPRGRRAGGARGHRGAAARARGCRPRRLCALAQRQRPLRGVLRGSPGGDPALARLRRVGVRVSLHARVRPRRRRPGRERPRRDGTEHVRILRRRTAELVGRDRPALLQLRVARPRPRLGARRVRAAPALPHGVSAGGGARRSGGHGLPALQQRLQGPLRRDDRRPSLPRPGAAVSHDSARRGLAPPPCHDHSRLCRLRDRDVDPPRRQSDGRCRGHRQLLDAADPGRVRSGEFAQRHDPRRRRPLRGTRRPARGAPRRRRGERARSPVKRRTGAANGRRARGGRSARVVHPRAFVVRTLQVRRRERWRHGRSRNRPRRPRDGADGRRLRPRTVACPARARPDDAPLGQGRGSPRAAAAVSFVALAWSAAVLLLARRRRLART